MTADPARRRMPVNRIPSPRLAADMPLSAPANSLSAKLLALTILFVLLAEVLVYTPSIARFRLSYLEEKLAAAHIAALSVEAAPDFMVTRALQAKLLAYAGAHAIDLVQPDARVYMLSSTMPPRVDAVLDLRAGSNWSLTTDALMALVRGEARVIRVIDRSPKDRALRIEVTMDERPMIDAMREFTRSFLAVSVAISLIAGGLLFVALNGLLVRPMRRLTASMVAFGRAPDAAPAVPADRGRRDEIGVAGRELTAMQETVRTALRQRARLAALGTAVAKINHDLRAILSTAALLSERLGESADPEVRRVTPRLMASIDRAVELCGQTLSFTRDGVLPLNPESADLRALADQVGMEVLATVRPDGQRVEAAWDNRIPVGLTIRADPGQLARALVNLGRNAVQAGASTVGIAAEPSENRTDGKIVVTIADDGPGLPPRARENLFQPFAGSARAGGVGLGLAIAREIARAHGGDLRLVSSTAQGTRFALELPATIGHPAVASESFAPH